MPKKQKHHAFKDASRILASITDVEVSHHRETPQKNKR